MLDPLDYSDHQILDTEDEHSYTYPHWQSRFQLSSVRTEALPATPPKPNPPIERKPPVPAPYSVAHPHVQYFLQRLSFAFCYGGQYYRPAPTDTAFAVAALAFFDYPAEPAHTFFWGPGVRAATAALVQRVLESGQSITIPVHWSSAAAAVRALEAREPRRVVAGVKAATVAGGGKAAEKTQRVTRATAARQQAAVEGPPTTPTTNDDKDTATPNDKKRRRTPPAAEAATTTPQRTSARQQKQRAMQEDVPAAVVASVAVARPAHVRSRSTSQESAQTLVASSSSRAVSVLSADTVVDVVSSGGGKKGRVIAAASEVAPMVSESGGARSARMATRSRTKVAPQTTKKTPYPSTKDAQLAAGRGKNPKAPTGKRKVAKAKN
ncbi:hypothetical protein C8R43DRAFT_973245 [Mycena crocata]|nr:hypothetical protein C8R43DRAFT_973245 [Mycena crocata]